MTSTRDRQAARDFADFDNDRKEGRYAKGGDRADWFTEAQAPAPLDPEKQAALDVAMAQMEAAFGPWCRESKRFLGRPVAVAQRGEAA